ncbi:MAG: hypothetical protein J6K53_03770 [Roseburia sp.]|nr:hypothetical protein [Roseburia sp.]
MNDKKKEKLKSNLVELGLMEQEDTIIECLQANYRRKLLGNTGEWKQGWIYFTEKKIVYPTGLLDENIVIPYESIRRIEKCSQGFIPMGIAVTYDDPKTGSETEDRFSISKRDKWIAFLSEKAGL